MHPARRLAGLAAGIGADQPSVELPATWVAERSTGAFFSVDWAIVDVALW